MFTCKEVTFCDNFDEMHTISTCFVGQNMTDIDNVIFSLLRKIIKGHSSPFFFLDKTDKNFMFVIQQVTCKTVEIKEWHS